VRGRASEKEREERDRGSNHPGSERETHERTREGDHKVGPERDERERTARTEERGGELIREKGEEESATIFRLFQS